MSLNYLPDEELDKLFKQSAESLDPTYDPKAWKTMEKKLDRVITGSPWWNKYFYPLLILLLMVSTLTVYKFYQQTKVYSLDKESTDKSGTPDELREQVIENDQLTALHKIFKGELRGNIPLVSGTSFQKVRSEKIKTMSQTLVNPKRSEINKQKYTLSNNTNRRLYKSEYQPIVLTPVLSKISGSISNTADKNEWPYLTKVGSEFKKVALSDAMIQSKNNLIDTASHRMDETDKSNFLNELQIMVAFAPDITTVKFRDRDALSANAGLLAGISLTKKFSVVTGLIWANKVYVAKPENYKPSQDFWNDKKLPSSIDARCQVIDIPVNISYRIFESNKDRLSIQAGLSSYIMLNEKYTYNYTYGYKPYSKALQIENQNRHWFGVQNFSVNYSRKLSPGISVGVEPFVKLPLSGIGSGNVDLTSAGVFLTAGYTLQLKK